jgi:hypothetical protein
VMNSLHRCVFIDHNLYMYPQDKGKCCSNLVSYGEVWAHKTSLIPLLFIYVHVPSQESERLCNFCQGFSNLTVTLKPVIQIIYNMKPCNITSRSLSIARLSESNKTTAHI